MDHHVILSFCDISAGLHETLQFTEGIETTGHSKTKNAIAPRPNEKGMLSACANLQDVQDVQVHCRMV